MKKKIKKINAAILIIGNEILSGRTQDKNVNFISNCLNSKCGISVKEVRIIPDDEKIIAKNILFLSKKFNVRINSCPTIRTSDKIALSTRNKLLNKKSLEKASHIAKLLIKIKKIIIFICGK